MEATMPQPEKPRALFEDVRTALGVGDQMADALVRSSDRGWQRQMIERYGARLGAWQKDDLARRIVPRDDDEEAFAK
jgi:hypothetical protein